MSLGYKVKDLGNGNISVTCDLSGLPFTRTTMLGMFCDDPNGCSCEAQANEMESPEDLIESLAKMIGLNI